MNRQQNNKAAGIVSAGAGLDLCIHARLFLPNDNTQPSKGGERILVRASGFTLNLFNACRFEGRRGELVLA